jgi:hypothetical protein
MAAPTVTSYAPTNIPANAGGAVVATGTGFTGTTSVKVNGATATFVITDATHLAITTPNADPGVAKVEITNADGTLVSTTGLTITPYVVPTRAFVTTGTGVFDTSGTTRFTNNIQGQYEGLDKESFSGAYNKYLAQSAKIKAVILFNKRYPALALPVPTF